jgi:site-specific recombinase XerD
MAGPQARIHFDYRHPLDASNVRREFRRIMETAGLGAGWAPRDLRHTFVSLISADGVPIEEIVRLAGHNQTATSELVLPP